MVVLCVSGGHCDARLPPRFGVCWGLICAIGFFIILVSYVCVCVCVRGKIPDLKV